MKYEDAKQKLLAMGGTCIGFQEQLNYEYPYNIVITLHHPDLGRCASGHNFAAAFEELDQMLTGRRDETPEEPAQEVAA